MKHLFILNPKSFWHPWKQEQVLARIHNFFKIAGADDYMIHISRFPRDAVGFIETFAAKLPEDTTLRVYAVGGDGILFDCLNGIMGLPNVELGIMPYGRTNNFIQNFGKRSKKLFRDIERQFASPAVPMDVIRCDHIYALNFCTMGTVSLAIRNTVKLQSKMEEGGPFSQWLGRRIYNGLYYAGAFSACLNPRTLRQQYRIEADGDDLSGQYRSIIIGNGSFYMGNKFSASSAVLNDGLLETVFVRGGGRLRALRIVPFYLRSWQGRYPKDFVIKWTRKLHISSEETMLVNLDDIAFFGSDCMVEVLHKAVQFVDVSQGIPEAGGK
jgi:diacylglycerol kinase family enzyme